MLRLKYITTILTVLIGFNSCREAPIPKPRGYFRLSLPDRDYKEYKAECGFSFRYPDYFSIKPGSSNPDEKCWLNLMADDLNATVYLTYKPVEDNLPGYIEDIRTIVYKHIIKADDIEETRINIPKNNVYGILYDILGNTASSVNFFITDSSDHFMSGSLYFNSAPNRDSLDPAIDFVREDILYLINHTNWN